ncbi:hypothetical protein [Phenylobacterium sp.]|jgi:hypothetical protein|uniref:hypothetical protein n=1 Tax=Phenylobacterium sp. TaxID=1871053 RepID=UPI0037844692
MASTAYSDTYPTRPTLHLPTKAQPGVGVTAFLWLAWAAIAAFWGFSLTTGIGIISALGHPANSGPGPGEADVGGVGWGLMNVVGVAILGAALAYGAYRYATRDRGKDAMTEASTAALYDIVEEQGGEDLTTRSPEAREPTERDAYQAAVAPPR